MLSPIHISSGEQMRDEMSKTPTYRTDLGNQNGKNSLIINQGSGALEGPINSQRMVQIIENSSQGKGTVISDFEKKMALDKSTTAGGRSSYDEMANNQEFLA